MLQWKDIWIFQEDEKEGEKDMEVQTMEWITLPGLIKEVGCYLSPLLPVNIMRPDLAYGGRSPPTQETSNARKNHLMRYN
jgi:hypothetical protein